MATAEISCPVLRSWAPGWSTWWIENPAQRRACLDALAERGIIGAAEADAGSMVAPDLIYPPWHACASAGGNGDGGPIGRANDEGEAERAAADAEARAAAGLVPLPGAGLIKSVPDWLKWLAWGAVAVGVVYLVVKARRRA